MRWEQYQKEKAKQQEKIAEQSPKAQEIKKTACVNGHDLKEFGSPRWRWDAFHSRYYESGVYCRQCCINRSNKYRRRAKQ